MIKKIGVTHLKLCTLIDCYKQLICFHAVGDHLKIDVALSQGEAGVAMRKYLHQMIFGVQLRFGARVLILPQDPKELLRGRKRQAWRTNSKRAEELGIRVRRVDDAEFPGLALRASRSPNPPMYLTSLMSEPMKSYMETWVSETADGEVVGFARFATDTNCAFLKYFVTTTNRDLSIARWRMASFIFENFSRRGLSYVISGSALSSSEGIKYFQDRLGFTTAHLLTTQPCSAERNILPNGMREPSWIHGAEL